jgi:hypothetical protein
MKELTIPHFGKNRLIDKQAHKSERVTPTIIDFEGTSINWEKSTWTFQHADNSIITKDVYSIYNPGYWKEISQRLAAGEKCAMMIAGSYGVGMLFESPEWTDSKQEVNAFEELKKVKKDRPWKQNFVALVHPDDQFQVIDIDRLHPNLQHLRWAHNRDKAHGWAQHNVYPARNTGKINTALLREEDQSIACFWIRDHWGFEGLTAEMRKKVKHGMFGGGSLNFHGENPGFTSAQLRQQIAEKPEWLEELDFVIRDEIVEDAEIQRSQPMVSFLTHEPTLIRHGSISHETIAALTGYPIAVAENAKYASSTTQYDSENNARIDKQALQTQAKIARFKDYVKTSGLFRS